MELNAEQLANELWDNLLKVKNKEISHEIANAANAAGREILKRYGLEQKVRSMQEPIGTALSKFFEIE